MAIPAHTIHCTLYSPAVATVAAAAVPCMCACVAFASCLCQQRIHLWQQLLLHTARVYVLPSPDAFGNSCAHQQLLLSTPACRHVHCRRAACHHRSLCAPAACHQLQTAASQAHHLWGRWCRVHVPAQGELLLTNDQSCRHLRGRWCPMHVPAQGELLLTNSQSCRQV